MNIVTLIYVQMLFDHKKEKKTSATITTLGPTHLIYLLTLLADILVTPLPFLGGGDVVTVTPGDGVRSGRGALHQDHHGGEAF